LIGKERDKICREPKFERIVPLYHKTDVLGLQAFLWDTFNLWAGNGIYVEENWKIYKDKIFKGMKRYVPQ